jgi:hypothetical protein
MIRDSIKKEFLYFFISLLLISWLINSFSLKFLFSSNSIDNDYFVALKNIYYLNLDKKQNKIIILGSSMSREGIDQEYISNRLNHIKVYNLSVSSGKPTDFYLILNNIKNIKKINLVIITLAPWMFQNKYTQEINDDTGLHLFFKPVPVLKLFSNIQPSWFLKNTLSSIWGFYGYNDFLNQTVDHQNLSFWKTKEERTKPDVWQQYKYKEGQPESYFLSIIQNREKPEERFNANYNWDEEKNIQYKALKELLYQLQSKKIPTLIVSMPLNPYIDEVYEDGIEEQYEILLDSISSSNIKVYNYSRDYSKDMFIDFYHLNKEGRDVFSQELYKIIEENYGF